MKDQSPCFPECDSRTQTCHATCEAYLKWAEKRRTKKGEIIKAKRQVLDLAKYDYAKQTDAMRKKRWKGK